MKNGCKSGMLVTECLTVAFYPNALREMHESLITGKAKAPWCFKRSITSSITWPSNQKDINHITYLWRLDS